MSTSVVKCSWVKCSEGLNNRVSTVIKRYIGHMKFAACMAVYHILSYSLVLFCAAVCKDLCIVCFCLIL